MERNIDMGQTVEEAAKEYIYKARASFVGITPEEYEEKREFFKVIDIYEHTGWCISLDGVNPCELLDFEVCQGSVIGNVYDNPELLKGGSNEE